MNKAQPPQRGQTPTLLRFLVGLPAVRTAAAVLTSTLLLGAAVAWASGSENAPSPRASSPSPSSQPTASGGPRFSDWFEPAAMRVDLVHVGNASQQSYGLESIAREPVWPGTRRYLIDPFGYGTYRLRLLDAATGKEIFRYGYATLFEEWTGTNEATRGVVRSMSESVRFPWPRRPVVLHIDRRDKKRGFVPMYSLSIDPSQTHVSRARPYSHLEVVDLTPDAPSPEHALDIVIVPEGYARQDEAKLRADLQRFSREFLSSEPWKHLASRVHLRGLVAFSPQSGVSEPRKGIFRDTLLGSSFDTFGSPRYLTITQTRTLRRVAARVPYDTIYVMVNTSRYGGGGVYNQWSVFPSDNEYDTYVMLHEYGHHMGGLGDEYYSSSVATDEDAMYPPGYEPWEPNLTAYLEHDRNRIKWKALIAPSTPIPTPEQPQFAHVVGLFEGAGYKAKGLYRPQMDCKMFHKGSVPFCKVCARSLENMTRYYTGEELLP